VFPLLTQQAPLTQLDPLGQQAVAPEEVQTWPLGQQPIPTQTSPLGQQTLPQTWLVGQQVLNPMQEDPLPQQKPTTFPTPMPQT
jgi:hypothetical protein